MLAEQGSFLWLTVSSRSWWSVVVSERVVLLINR